MGRFLACSTNKNKTNIARLNCQGAKNKVKNPKIIAEQAITGLITSSFVFKLKTTDTKDSSRVTNKVENIKLSRSY
jgi:hypothetical protein